MSKGLVIVVEDDPTIRRIYSAGLGKAGYTVLAAPTGEEGVALLSQHRPKVVILDVNLPGIDGIEVCRRSRSLAGGGAPVIFITTNDSVEVLHQCIDAGGDDFLVKGGPVRALLERVTYWARNGGRGMNEAQRKRILEKTAMLIDAHEEIDAQPGKLDADPEVARIVDVFDSLKDTQLDMDDRSVPGRMNRLGYVTGLVNAAAKENLRMKVQFIEYLRAVMIACGVAEPKELDVMFENWHELYDNMSFAAACVAGEQDYEKAA